MKPLPDIHDVFAELTEPHTHREPYEPDRPDGEKWTTNHITTVPALVDQLDASPSGAGTDRNSSGYGSRPAARIEAIDALILIDLESARWVRDLGEDDPGDTKACLRRLHGLRASAQDATKEAVDRDVRRWWRHARIMSGWDSAAWRPDNSCPVCEKRRTLRIRLSDEAGFCVECRADWDELTIGLLAEHIRAEPRPRGGGSVKLSPEIRAKYSPNMAF